MSAVRVISLLLLVLGIYCLIAYVRLQMNIRVGEALVRKAKAFEQHPDNPTKKVLFLGDSSAVGVGAVTPEGSVPGYLGTDHPEYDITNIAVSGARVADIAEQLKNPRIENTHFDLIVLHIGANDVVHMSSMSKVKKTLDEQISVLLQKGERLVLIHGGDVGTSRIFPLPVRMWLTHRTKVLRAFYQDKESESDQIGYADVIAVENGRFANDPKKYYAADHFHPSAEGYKVWYEAILRTP